MPANDSRKISPQFIAWGIFAAIGGVCSLVLPPFLTRGGLPQPAYGWPLVPWFEVAWANQRVTDSKICFLVLGFTLGIAQPRRWLFLTAVAMALPVVWHVVHILNDFRHDATSHNLLPFEFFPYAFSCWPAVVGGFLGYLCRRFFERLRPAA